MKVPERFKAGISRYQPSDADDLATFQRAQFGADARQLDPARIAWLFERNPCRSDEDAPLWMCRRKGEVVGQQAEIAFELLADGQLCPAAWAIDLMVEPAWRLKGVGPGLTATQLDGHDIVVGLTQSAEALNAYLRGGWTDVGVVPMYVRPIDARRFLRVAPAPERLRPLGPVAGPVVRGIDVLAGLSLRGIGAHLVPVDRFDERVDEVWATAHSDYPVLAVRDAATTRWRLDERPDADELRRYYLMRRSRTIGYVALRHQDRWGDQAAFVIDYLAPRHWVAPLLTLAARAAGRDGAFALVCRTLNEPLDRALQIAGFLRRGVDVTSPLHLVLHCTDTVDDAVSTRFAKSCNWYLTLADSDMS